MQVPLENKSSPIHRNINHKGMLRKMHQGKLNKSVRVQENAESLVLDLMKSDCTHNQNIRDSINERLGVYSSIKGRILRRKQLHSRRPEILSARDRIQLKLEANQASPQYRSDSKNKTHVNLFVSRRTTPLYISSSRNRNNIQYSHPMTIKLQPISINQKGLKGYQICSQSPMNKKIVQAGN